MYSSLDKIDIATKDGRCVQTDHRSAAEIEAEADVSIVFAVTRVLNALRRYEGARVTYTCMADDPPGWLVQAVELTGGEVEVMRAGVPTTLPRRRAADREVAVRLVHEALRRLGSKVLADAGLAPDQRGIEQLENEARARVDEVEDDGEIAKWTASVELGAALGEALFALEAGVWVEDTFYKSIVPFAVKTGDATSNVFGRIERFFEEGRSQAPSKLLLLAAERGEPMGPLMPNLKPAAWSIDGMVAERLIASSARGGDFDIPWIVYGNDRPQSFAFLQDEPGEPPADLAALRAEAERNLRGQRVNVASIGGTSNPGFIVSESFYAAEKILDTQLMRDLQKQLGVPLLAVSVPCKGRLIATSGVLKEGIARHAALAEKLYGQAQSDRISKELFAVVDGNASGVARIVTEPARPASGGGGFWSRLFGK